MCLCACAPGGWAVGAGIARFAGMGRRIAAMIGLVAVVALALTLLYRVYVHHSQAEPYVEEPAGAVVRMDWTESRPDA